MDAAKTHLAQIFHETYLSPDYIKRLKAMERSIGVLKKAVGAIRTSTGLSVQIQEYADLKNKDNFALKYSDDDCPFRFSLCMKAARGVKDSVADFDVVVKYPTHSRFLYAPIHIAGHPAGIISAPAVGRMARSSRELGNFVEEMVKSMARKARQVAIDPKTKEAIHPRLRRHFFQRLQP